jgi:nicotinamide-nucleotide amidase
MLTERNGTLALAESCTGGMLAAQLVDCPGASSALLIGYVTYSNASKIKALGVNSDIIAQCGAVSAECALAMAEGARAKSGADYALSITGIAGPDGGTAKKPVGAVFVGLAGDFETTVKHYTLRGDRARIRSLSCLYALDLLRQKLLALDDDYTQQHSPALNA